MLLLRKGVYPYEYMDDWNKFNENELPLKEEFYSNLNMSNISDKEYEYAKKVWNTLNIKNLGEYHDLYVQLDTALLADVFENFIKVCLIQYKLEPCYFLSVPGLAWTPMLKITKVKLELLTDVDMLLMFGKGTRGEISQAVHNTFALLKALNNQEFLQTNSTNKYSLSSCLNLKFTKPSNPSKRTYIWFLGYSMKYLFISYTYNTNNNVIFILCYLVDKDK